MNEQDKMQQLLTLGLGEGQAPALAAAVALFSLRRDVLQHPRFNAAVREIARIHHRGRSAGVAEGALFVGQTGSGKSTLLHFYADKFPRSTGGETAKIPVLVVETPESPSVKDLAEAMLRALGDPAAAKGKTSQQTERIINFCKQCGVELVLLDEFQHFFDGTRVAEARKVSDWLKLLMNNIGRPFVLFGLPRAIQVVNINPQLRRRFAAPYYLEPFAFTTEADMREFRAVLKLLQMKLPMGSVSISEANMARRFYFASHGLFDYIVKVIDDAASRGGSGSNGMLTMADYALAFKRVVWSAAPDQLNPFIESAKLRLLTQPLEPFDVWDDISQYTTRIASTQRQDAKPSGPSKGGRS